MAASSLQPGLGPGLSLDAARTGLLPALPPIPAVFPPEIPGTTSSDPFVLLHTAQSLSVTSGVSELSSHTDLLRAQLLPWPRKTDLQGIPEWVGLKGTLKLI